MRANIGYFCIFLATCCWGLLGPVSRFALESDISPMEVAFWRCAFGFLFFGIHAIARNATRIQTRRDGIIFALLGVFSVAGFFVSYQYAVKTGGAALASVLLYTAPAWVAFFSRFLLGEHLGKTKITAIAIALAGVYCISVSGGGGNGNTQEIRSGFDAGINFPGVFFGLLAGLLYSTHYLFATHFLARYKAITLYGYLMLFGALALLPFIHFMPKAPSDWLALFFISAVSTYGAYCFYCEGLKRLAPTRAAVLATFEPVMATLAAWWIWGESFAASGWAGSALIVGAVLCLILAPGRDGRS